MHLSSSRAWIASVSWLALGSVASQVVNAISIPLLTRVFDPVSLGLWAVMQSYVLGAASIAGLRYELALPLAKDVFAPSIVRLQLLLSGVVACVFMAWLVVHTPDDLSLVRDDLKPHAFVLVGGLLVLGSSLTQLACQFLLREGRFGALAVTRFTSSAGVTLAQILLGFLAGGRAAVLMIGAMLASVVAGILGGRKAWRLLKVPSKDGFRSLWVSAVEFRQFPLFVAPYGFVTVARDRGILLLLVAYADVGLVGLLALAQRLVALPVGLGTSALSPIVHKMLINAERITDHERIVLIILRCMIWVGAPVFLCLALFADSLAPVVLGSEWTDIGPLCVVLSVSGFTLFLSGLFDRTFDIVRQQARALWIEGSNTVFSLAVVWYLLEGGFDFMDALLGFVITNAIHHVVWIAVVWRTLGFSRAGLEGVVLHVSTAAIVAASVWVILGGAV